MFLCCQKYIRLPICKSQTIFVAACAGTFATVVFSPRRVIIRTPLSNTCSFVGIDVSSLKRTVYCALKLYIHVKNRIFNAPRPSVDFV